MSIKREDIKRIMIRHSDNDFISVWDWIGKVFLMTINKDSNLFWPILEEQVDIENFIKSLIPTGIEFVMYRTDKYNSKYSRYRNIDSAELQRLVEHVSRVEFKYNFDYTDGDWIYGGHETLIIDIENNESFIR